VCGKSVFVSHLKTCLPREPRNVKSPWARLARSRQVRTSLARIFFPPVLPPPELSSSLRRLSSDGYVVDRFIDTCRKTWVSLRVYLTIMRTWARHCVLHLSFALNPVTVIIYRELLSLLIQYPRSLSLKWNFCQTDVQLKLTEKRGFIVHLYSSYTYTRAHNGHLIPFILTF